MSCCQLTNVVLKKSNNSMIRHLIQIKEITDNMSNVKDKLLWLHLPALCKTKLDKYQGDGIRKREKY